MAEVPEARADLLSWPPQLRTLQDQALGVTPASCSRCSAQHIPAHGLPSWGTARRGTSKDVEPRSLLGL